MRIPLTRTAGDDTPIAWWEFIFTPLVLLVFFGLAALSVPYMWLYPNATDKDGMATETVVTNDL